MTRTLILISALLSTGIAQASTPTLGERFEAPAALTEAKSFNAAAILAADLSFGETMRLITTLTLPELSPTAALASRPQSRQKTEYIPALRAQEEAAKEAKSSDGTFRPKP